MAKVGVLIFTDKAKERVFKTKDFYEAKKNFGIKKVLSQLDCDYEFCSSLSINNYEHVFCSITSYYDILNLVRNVPKERTANVHIGGPGVNNIRGYLDYFNTAWFGRCDHGEINGIISGEKYKSLYRKKDDPDFIGEYEVCPATVDGIGHEGEEETSVGCRQKCAFCHYSWWNKYIEKNEESYKSGQASYEDFFQHLDWSRGRAITALDGMTEKTRMMIRKPISYGKIKEKLLESNNIPLREKNLAVKMYSIIGYPWEEKDEIDKCDITKAFKEIGDRIKNPILMYFHLSHFVPMQKTPMWYVPFNFNNYWLAAKETPVLFESENVKLYTGTSTTSPASAAEETIIQRAQIEDQKILEIISAKKWRRLRANEKLRVMKKELMRFFIEQEEETIQNIKTAYNYHGWCA